MKAIVKSSGDVFEVSDTTTIYPEHYDKSYNITEVEFLDVKGNSFPKDEPDYWTRLEHQAAIAAMQGILSNPELFKATAKNAEEFGLIVPQAVTIDANCFAHTLVQKLKEKEEK